MMYASETCGFRLPEKLMDAFGTNAGVTKKMVVEQGGPTIREAPPRFPRRRPKRWA